MKRLANASGVLLTAAMFLGYAGDSAAEARPDHHEKNRFRNPLLNEPYGGIFGFLKARFFGSEQWARHDPDEYQVPTATPSTVPTGLVSDNARVTWIGHATVLIQHQGINVLTDPMFSRRAGPGGFLGPARISEPAMTIDALPPIHAVLISHNHYDHLDLASLRNLERLSATRGASPAYFVPLGNRSLLAKAGVSASRIQEMDWWATAGVTVGGTSLTVTATPAQHFSGRSLTDQNRALWASWAVQWKDFSVWFGGDTGYNDVQFKEIGRHFGGFDLGIIPIGAYRPRSFMANVHVDPAEALMMHRDIQAKRSLPVHWGTFILSAEHPSDPPAELAQALVEAGHPDGDFQPFAIGESRSYPAGVVRTLAWHPDASTLGR
jgi:N-acyl-phosphatidylethanolamine-hydrolysing phospholipase D